MAISYAVYHGSTFFSSTANIAITSTAGGETIYVIAEGFTNAAQSYGVTDNKSGGSQTYASITNLTQGDGVFRKQYGWYFFNSASGVTNIAVTNNGGADFQAVVYVMSGMVAGDTLDVSAGNSNITATLTPNGASITPSTTSSIVIQNVSDGQYTTVSSNVGGGTWTLDYNGAQGGGGNFGPTIASQIVSATTTIQAQFSGGASSAYCNGGVCFKGAASSFVAEDDSWLQRPFPRISEPVITVY